MRGKKTTLEIVQSGQLFFPSGYSHMVAFTKFLCAHSRKEEKDISFTVLSIRLNRCCSHTLTTDITINCADDPLFSLN